MPRTDSQGNVIPWSPLSQGISVALWTSFVMAGCETMVVFAFLDPATLGIDGLSPSLAALRPMIYGCGFFFFWSFSFIGAALTVYMMLSGPRAAGTQPPAGPARDAAADRPAGN